MASPDNEAAKRAIMGAIMITEKPRYAKAINPSKLRIIMITPKSYVSLLIEFLNHFVVKLGPR